VRKHLGLSIAELLVKFPCASRQRSQNVVVIGVSQGVGKPEDHSQRQPWLAVAESIEALPQEPHR
jgi:hypothetical protein